jgi:AcrR family transcriptional regulator
VTAATRGESTSSPASLPGDERILRATIEALAEMDPAALTIQHICRRAGATAPTLYYHFGSKDGLIAAAVERLVSDWLALLDATVAREGDLDATLDQAVAGWRAMIQAPTSPVVVFVWVTLLAAGTSEQSRDALIRARDRSQEMIRQAVAIYFGDTALAADLAATVVGGIISAALQFHLDADEAALTQRLTAMVRVVRAVADASQP